MADTKVVNVHCEEMMDTALLDVVVLIIDVWDFLTDEATEGDVGIMIMPYNDLVSVHCY